MARNALPSGRSVTMEVPMDRRQQKTRDAIFNAFAALLQKKHFNNLTVQEIIDEANIGRSTFYAHFETKDMLLKEMCTDIFDHIFAKHLTSETTHDFSLSADELQTKLTHLLYHLRDDKQGAVRVLCSESGDLFMGFFKDYLMDMFSRYKSVFPKDAPVDFVLNLLTGSFAETVRWWIRNDMKECPEKVTEYYLTVLRLNETGAYRLPARRYE